MRTSRITTFSAHFNALCAWLACHKPRWCFALCTKRMFYYTNCATPSRFTQLNTIILRCEAWCVASCLVCVCACRTTSCMKYHHTHATHTHTYATWMTVCIPQCIGSFHSHVVEIIMPRHYLDWAHGDNVLIMVPFGTTQTNTNNHHLVSLSYF